MGGSDLNVETNHTEPTPHQVPRAASGVGQKEEGREDGTRRGEVESGGSKVIYRRDKD